MDIGNEIRTITVRRALDCAFEDHGFDPLQGHTIGMEFVHVIISMVIAPDI
ncbi:hypothetical protein DPMN_006180 [Dreissena polymorpha]|uniref:Uncharacterized protein n=1 Tax=Dreissena polymorpha TaxID=45954 RepID=A0A9D4MTJ3_DREPO|nr:hypothetical protein DPMN_006180 [Dreissena polymorpha]